jgi:hypothetical protein
MFWRSVRFWLRSPKNRAIKSLSGRMIEPLTSEQSGIL